MFLFKSKSKQDKNEVPCKFGYSFPNEIYSCYIKDQQQINYRIDKLKAIEPHHPFQNNDTVKKVQFTNCKLTYMPSGLNYLFQFINILIIEYSDINHICSYDLIAYECLTKFVCKGCKIQYLPGDLFEFTKSIEFIDFGESDLRFIEPNILDGLDNLKHVNFYGQSIYSISYSIYPYLFSNATLQELKDYLYERWHEKYGKILDSKISEGVNREKEILLLGKLISDDRIKQFEASEAKLNKQLKQLQESEKSLNQEIQQIRSESGRIKKENGQLKHSNTLLEQQLASLETKNENYRTESKQLRIFGERVKRENRELKENKTKADREIFKLKESQKKLTQQVQQLKNSESKLKSENDELKYSKSKFQNQLQESINFEKQQNFQIEQLKTIEKNLIEKTQELEKIKATLAYDLISFTQNETTKDFKIIIEGQEFPVHKFLLAARSPTLAEILKNNPEVENLNLVDISVKIFEIILKFLYTDELPGEDGTNFLQLFAAAGKLKITKLVEHAGGNLIDHVDNENALEILRLSASFKLEDLRLKAFELLKKKFSDINFEEKWLENPEKLIKVVTMLKKKEEILKKFEDEFKEVTEIK